VKDDELQRVNAALTELQVKNEARDAIIMRICNRLPRNYVHVEETLAEAGFFDLLEAAERSQREADKFGHRDYEEEMRWIAETLRDAIRRAKEGA
jgi:hypothetical protein